MVRCADEPAVVRDERSASGPSRPGYWDKVRAGWSAAPRRRLWRAHSDAVNAALVRRWQPDAPGRVLKTDLFDEAVGDGLVAELAEAGHDVVGMDLAPGVARAARTRHPALAAVACDVRSLPFRRAAFDAIVSNSTLDHFATRDELERGLDELARVLAPGGWLVLTLDNPRNPLVALRNALPLGWLRAVGLVPYYVGATLGPREVVAALERAGLEVLALDAVLHVPRAPAVGAASLLGRTDVGAVRRAFLAAAGAFEVLSRLPTRFFTGHYVAALAEAPPPDGGPRRAEV